MHSSRWKTGPRSSAVMLTGGPQTVLMETKHVHLRLFPISFGYSGSTLTVHLQHQFGGLFQGVAEQFLQHVGDVTHQVDRVVPDEDHPRSILINIKIGIRVESEVTGELRGTDFRRSRGA